VARKRFPLPELAAYENCSHKWPPGMYGLKVAYGSLLPSYEIKDWGKAKRLFVSGWLYCCSVVIGSISNDDDDGRENITKKMNLLPFKLYRV